VIESAVPPLSDPLGADTLATIGLGGVISSAAGRIESSPAPFCTIRSA
jgi:hypothetical protein